jgi:HD-GYP domain-containing protein (c-di-GMP phosphodiesterase class II)
MPPEEALAEILRHSGTQFDPTAVKAFLSVYQARFVGQSQNRQPGRELSDALKQAIVEAANFEKAT